MSLSLIKKIHTCRLYLQVTFLSNITNLKGDSILSQNLKGLRVKNCNRKFNYPLQKRSNTHSWTLWDKILRIIYCFSSSTEKRLNKLHTPSLFTILFSIISKITTKMISSIIFLTQVTLPITMIALRQNKIGWDHFIWSRISCSFYSVLNMHFSSNKLGRRFQSSFWYQNIIKLIWQLHQTAWTEYCDSIH